MATREQLVVVGAGGFGQEIIWAARNTNTRIPKFEIVGFCDDDPGKQGKEIYGVRVLGNPEAVNASFGVKPHFVCAMGDNHQRKEMVSRLTAMGWVPATVIDPSVIVAEFVTVGEGTYVGAGSILSPYAKVGRYVIVNHCCTIGHNATLEDFVQISPGARISGMVAVGEGTSVGSNAVVAPGVCIGHHSTLGAASFAVRDLPHNCTAVGNPARVIFQQKD